MVDRQKQIAEAEELLANGHNEPGFAKQLYFGDYAARQLVAYPNLTADAESNRRLAEIEHFVQTGIDPVQIDRDADIPPDVIQGLGRLGVLGMCVPKSAGGLGYGQVQYCRVLEAIGARCASTAVFVNAHHSIGVRALVLFGTPAQQARWLPQISTGEHLGAFALTEPQAGSDAGNVQTMAVPTADGTGYRLTGEKRYITNGAIAQVLTVMARTPVANSTDTKVTAFLVTPDMPGFEVVEARMPKCGIRGTATARLAFHDMFVPKENILGPLGKGLKVALTVLDYGRTTFGASCTGAAKFCVERAVNHAQQRVQFGLPLGKFELIKSKLAHMAAGAWAMEACTYQTAALIDSGNDDYMVETAMLKVFATDVLWQTINETIQVYGGSGYFNDQPFERMLRDARINTIGEGANEVLRGFIALSGVREVGTQLQGVAAAVNQLFERKGWSTLGAYASQRLGRVFMTPQVLVRDARLQPAAHHLAELVKRFGGAVESLIFKRREQFERMDFMVGGLQYPLARLADAAIEIYVSACVLSRLDHCLQAVGRPAAERSRDWQLANFYLTTAARRIREVLVRITDNDDDLTTHTADVVLGYRPGEFPQ